MKKRQLKNENDFVNGITSPASLKNTREKKYKAISVSLTDEYIEKIDSIILFAAKKGIIKITRSEIIKLAIDKLKNEDILSK